MSETQPPVRPLLPHEKRRDELADVRVGQRLCEIGRGTANVIHRHVMVTRLTKLYVVTEYTNKYGTFTHRFRKDSGRSVPYSDYGGSSVYTTCQRPKKESK